MIGIGRGWICHSGRQLVGEKERATKPGNHGGRRDQPTAHGRHPDEGEANAVHWAMLGKGEARRCRVWQGKGDVIIVGIVGIVGRAKAVRG